MNWEAVGEYYVNTTGNRFNKNQVVHSTTTEILQPQRMFIKEEPKQKPTTTVTPSHAPIVIQPQHCDTQMHNVVTTQGTGAATVVTSSANGVTSHQNVITSQENLAVSPQNRNVTTRQNLAVPPQNVTGQETTVTGRQLSEEERLARECSVVVTMHGQNKYEIKLIIGFLNRANHNEFVMKHEFVMNDKEFHLLHTMLWPLIHDMLQEDRNALSPVVRYQMSRTRTLICSLSLDRRAVTFMKWDPVTRKNRGIITMTVQHFNHILINSQRIAGYINQAKNMNAWYNP